MAAGRREAAQEREHSHRSAFTSPCVRLRIPSQGLEGPRKTENHLYFQVKEMPSAHHTLSNSESSSSSRLQLPSTLPPNLAILRDVPPGPLGCCLGFSFDFRRCCRSYFWSFVWVADKLFQASFWALDLEQRYDGPHRLRQPYFCECLK